MAEAMTQTVTIRYIAKQRPARAQEAFKACIARIMVIASIRQAPDQILEAELWKYFQTHLQGFTFEDIRLAFTHHAAGDLGERIQHYQVLDINFISQVMNLYLEKKIALQRRIAALLPKPEEPKLPTPEESYNGLLEYIRKHGQFPASWAWKLVFDHMDELLMIEETMEKRHELMGRTLTRLTEAAELESLTSKNRMPDPETLKHNAQNECRKILIQKYLKP